MIRRISLKTMNGSFVCAENGGGGVIVANRPSPQPWEQLTVVPLDNDKVALQTYTGAYVCAEGGGSQNLIANRSAIGAWEQFSIVPIAEGRVALMACNGKYLCAEGGGGGKLVTDRSQIGDWESFEVIERDGPARIGLLTYSGHFVCAEEGGGREVVANRNVLDGWETLALTRHDRKWSFRTPSGHYFCADSAAGEVVRADRTALGDWELFEVVIHSGGWISLRAHNGKWVCAERGGGGELIANRDAIGIWEKFRVVTLSSPRVIWGGPALQRLVNRRSEAIWVKPEYSDIAIKVESNSSFEGAIDGYCTSDGTYKVTNGCSEVELKSDRAIVTCGNFDIFELNRKVDIEFPHWCVPATSPVSEAILRQMGGPIAESDIPAGDSGWKSLFAVEKCKQPYDAEVEIRSRLHFDGGCWDRRGDVERRNELRSFDLERAERLSRIA